MSFHASFTQSDGIQIIKHVVGSRALRLADEVGREVCQIVYPSTGTSCFCHCRARSKALEAFPSFVMNTKERASRKELAVIPSPFQPHAITTRAAGETDRSIAPASHQTDQSVFCFKVGLPEPRLSTVIATLSVAPNPAIVAKKLRRLLQAVLQNG